MRSQDKDESGTRQRQESLARRMAQALDQLKPDEARDCPDAAIIAAYAEQALAADETERWECHFAACARCRNILRVLSASAETPLAEKEVARLGELVSGARTPVAIRGDRAGHLRPKFAEWRTRWLAPAIGVAAVLVVWLVMRPPWRTTERGASPTLMAEAKKQELPPESSVNRQDQLSRVAPSQEQKTEAAVPPSSLDKATPPSSPAPEAAIGSTASGSASGSEPLVSGGLANAAPEKKTAEPPLEGGRNLPSAVPRTPSAQLQAQGAASAPAAEPSRAKVATNIVTGESLPAQSSSAAGMNAPAQAKQAGAIQAEARAATSGTAGQQLSADTRPSERQAFAVFRSPQKDSALLKAPSASVLWRAGKSGMIERSTDAGQTWISQASPSRQDWLAGAAVSDKICWLAGRNGAIARTVDGVHWELMPPPAQVGAASANPPDWTSITANDAENATVTAAGRGRFATSDGGKTWQQQ